MRANELDHRFEKMWDQSRQINTILQALERLSQHDESFDDDRELMRGLMKLASKLGRELPSEIEYCGSDVREVSEQWRKQMDELVDYRTGRRKAEAGGGQ